MLFFFMPWCIASVCLACFNDSVLRDQDMRMQHACILCKNASTFCYQYFRPGMINMWMGLKSGYLCTRFYYKRLTTLLWYKGAQWDQLTVTDVGTLRVIFPQRSVHVRAPGGQMTAVSAAFVQWRITAELAWLTRLSITLVLPHLLVGCCEACKHSQDQCQTKWV